MTWPFERGKPYNRRADIHARYGGQQQGGIITPKNHPLVIAVTGDEGAQHGYGDRWRPDGVFEYFGEGQVGDMQLAKGNKAIANHVANGRSLLLFRKLRNGRLQFEGEWICEGYHFEPGSDRTGATRQSLVFELRPLEAVEEAVEALPFTVAEGLDALRAKAFAAAQNSATTATSTRSIYRRSADVRNYILARASGRCEGCGTNAPFLRPDGSPYLEPHHIRRVSDGGPDDPRFVIALCPNCHRRVHAGADGAAFNAGLLEAMKTIEPKRAL